MFLRPWAGGKLNKVQHIKNIYKNVQKKSCNTIPEP